MNDIEKRARELLPCPFCGYRAKRTRAHSTVAQRVAGYDLLQFGVRCCADLTCECELRGFATRDEADEAWNTRATLSPPEGFVLVPISPTQEMIEGFWGKIQHGEHERAAAEDAWRDALAVRPGCRREEARHRNCLRPAGRVHRPS